jgi:hypothetical protein
LLLKFGGFMLKKLSKILLLGTLVLFVAACTTATAVPTVVPTPIVITSAPIVVTATTAPTVPATATVTENPTAVPPTATSAPKITAVPTVVGAYSADGVPVSSASSIIITSIKASDVKAQINWSATGTFDNGFWIYYSTSYKLPFYGGYPLFQVSGSTTRTAYVDGNSGTTYYYRICAYNGSGCDFYSNSYAFTFPGSTPTP